MPSTPASPVAQPPPASQALQVGIDLVKVSEVREALDRFGARYLTRLFTPAEIDDAWLSPARAAERLAARFAAKEATIKALRPTARWLDWRAIELVRHPSGWSDLRLHREAAALALAAGLSGWSVSLSHEGDYATAVVVAFRREGSPS